MGTRIDELKILIDRLIDEAVTEGRDMWDNYSGYNNDLHIKTVKQAYPTYARIMELLDEQNR